MTQTDRVLEYLRRYKTITALDALRDLGIMRLASRISDLKRRGYRVSRSMIEVENRFGEKTRVACYALEVSA